MALNRTFHTWASYDCHAANISLGKNQPKILRRNPKAFPIKNEKILLIKLMEGPPYYLINLIPSAG
jgi:hypothetical protein